MPEVQLKNLRAIQGNLAKVVKDKGALAKSLKVFFQSLLNTGRYQFEKKLSSEAVSDHFNNTIASKRLLKSFDRNINRALQIDSNGNLRFAFSIKSTPGSITRPDPVDYYGAIDEGKIGPGPSPQGDPGLTIERVEQWMKERGIVVKLKSGKGYRKTVTTPAGKKASVRSVAWAIRGAIIKKSRRRAYKALRLSEMFADIIDIKNPESFFRQTMRKQVSNIVLGKTA